MNRFKIIPFLIAFVFICGFASFAQVGYDTTRPYQSIGARPGYEYEGGRFKYSFVPPRDTVKLRMADSGAIAFKGNRYWQWSGVKWDTLKSTAGAGGASDNWGTQVVQRDNTLTGDGTSGNVLKVDTSIISTKSFVTNSIAGLGGGGGIPGGSNTQIQFNNSGAFGGSSNFTWNNTAKTLRITGDNAFNNTPILRLSNTASGGVKRILQFDEPVTYSTGGRQSFPFAFQWHPSDNGDGTTNNVFKWGSNIDGNTSGQSALFYSLEPDWVSGGLPYREAHLQYHHPDGTAVRLFSSTLQQRTPYNLTTNQWDFRSNVFAVKDLGNGGVGNDYFGVSKPDNSSANTAVSMYVSGNNPFFRLSNTNSSTTWDIQHDGNGGAINQGGLSVNSRYANEAQILLPILGGATGSSGIKHLWSDGNGVFTQTYGSSAGGGLANHFILFDNSNGTIFLDYRKATGNLSLGKYTGTNRDARVTIAGKLWVDGSITQPKDSLVLNASFGANNILGYDTVTGVYTRLPSTLFSGGSSTLSVLSDVTLTSIAANDFLKYDGTKWVNRTPANVRTDLGLGSLALLNTINNSNWSGTALADANIASAATWNAKQNNIVAGTTSQYYRGDKTFQTLDKTAVGLADVDNTSDATKNSATATLTNKTIAAGSNTITGLTNSNLSGTAGVTFANLQNIATQRLAGRNTAASGVIEEVTSSNVLDWVGSTQGTVLYRGASGWAALTPGTAGQVLQSGGAAANPSWVNASGGLADPTVNGIVSRTALNTTAARTLTGTANRITITNGNGVSGNPTFDIGSDVATIAGTQTLTNKTIAAGSNTLSGITNTHLSGTAGITYANLQNVSAGQRFLGRTAGTAGVVQEFTMTNALDWVSSTQGSLLYRGFAGWFALAPGTAGQVLQSGGAAANPSWVNSGGVPDGDKGDITTSGSGATYTIDNGVVGLAKLSATGTPSATTFLRGDNSFAAPKTIYTEDGIISGNRLVDIGSNTFQFIGSNSSGFSIKGSTFLVDMLNDKVGVGTLSPVAKLHVSTNSASLTPLIVSADGVGSGDVKNVAFRGYGTSKNMELNFIAANGVESTPASLANNDLIGGVSFSPYINSAPNNGLSKMYATYKGDGTTALSNLAFKTSAIDRMLIDESGNIGMGSASPNRHLDIEGAGIQAVEIRSTNTSQASVDLWYNSATQGYRLINGGSSLYVYNETSSNQPFTILNNGNVGIANTNPGYKLSVTGTARVTDMATVNSIAYTGFQEVTSGTSATISNSTHSFIYNPASTSGSFTITLPAAPVDGQEVRILLGGTLASAVAVTSAMSVLPNAGQSVRAVSSPAVGSGDCMIYQYKSSSAIWYRIK